MMWGAVIFELVVFVILMPPITWLWWDDSIHAQPVGVRRECVRGGDLILQVEMVQRWRRNRVVEFRYDGERWSTLEGKRIWSYRTVFELRRIYGDLLWEATLKDMLASAKAIGEA